MDHDVPAPGTVIAGVPTQFDELVLHATARDPQRRYADARDMAAELQEIVDDSVCPPSASRRLSNSAHTPRRSPPADPRSLGKPPPRRRRPQHTRELTRDDISPTSRSPNISRYQDNSPAWI